MLCKTFQQVIEVVLFIGSQAASCRSYVGFMSGLKDGPGVEMRRHPPQDYRVAGEVPGSPLV